MSILRTVALFLAPVSLVACADAATDPFEIGDDLDFRGTGGSTTGTTGGCNGCGTIGGGTDILNTPTQENCANNGIDVGGQFYDGWQFLGAFLRPESNISIPLQTVYAQDGILHGFDFEGAHYSGSDFVNSEWRFTRDRGSCSLDDEQGPALIPWTMKISEFVPDGARSRYVWQNGPSYEETENYNCLFDDHQQEYSAIVYTDLEVDETGTHHDRAETIYVGCISGAVGKAGMWGYPQHVVGMDMHQAAARMVRADYCGDGIAYTEVGTPLQIADIHDTNQFWDASLATEAIWSSQGAICLGEPRLGQGMLGNISCAGALPPCEGTGEEMGLETPTWSKVAL